MRARRRADKLMLTTIKGTEREEIEGIARGILEVLCACVGQSWDEVSEALGDVSRSAKYEKVWAGLKKLALDGCEFGTPLQVDAPALRKDIFELASKYRRESSAEAPFRRGAVILEVATKYDVPADALVEGMFSDLKGASKLMKPTGLSPEQLTTAYETAQVQGILLRAVRLSILLQCTGPDQARRFFRKLKFRQLLYRLEKIEDGRFQLELEGPFSLFESVTKYGLQLALLVPDLLECRRAEISAEVRWGKERRPLVFETTLRGGDATQDPEPQRQDVQALAASIAKKGAGWQAQSSTEIFDVPGVGLCIPDLKLSAGGKPDVYVEVLGFWSRDAVWRRVEWAQSGSPVPIIFAVSSRLRVSREVLPSDTGAALYVYKGTMSAAAILNQADDLSAAF